VGIGGAPSDSGTLGPVVVPDGLTVTLGVGSTLFDDRYDLAPQWPAKLTPMTPFPDDDLDPAQSNGDLILQLSAGNADTVMHALRDIARHTRGGMQAIWRMDGFTGPARPSGTVPRNQMGFMDGIANRTPATGRRWTSWSGSSLAPRASRPGRPGAATSWSG
jgi:deferrochelatase/peroxidase EfeB